MPAKMVVYHLERKTGWSKVVANGTHQNPEWKFPLDVRVPFPLVFKTKWYNLKKLAQLFQVAIHFHPGHPQLKTLTDSSNACISTVTFNKTGLLFSVTQM